ncbi:HAD family phosphatase [Actinoplanes sp. TFC3]|uniref:HAD family hydrolase n=1 Tax=Actinoplanes sp. TFC3 TaxID=1710355 RepID=UPI00082BA3C9|nr:HAD family phosphatase [Actinoplanes sp. TFC3]
MSLTTPIKAVWTDFGGVLTPPTGETLRVFCAGAGLEPAQLTAAMAAVGAHYGTDAMAPLDTPLVTEQEWARQVEAELAATGVHADLSDFGSRWFAGRPANAAWVQWLRAARSRGVFVGMLSNMVPAWDKQWRKMIPQPDVFDDLVMSFQVGTRKPEPAIFALAAERAGVAPHECVLVDDLLKNCDGARAQGWQAVHFTDAAQAAALLDPVLADARAGRR